MLATASLISLLAASASALALPASNKRDVSCPWNGVANGSGPFTLLSVFDADTTVQKPVGLGTNGLADSSTTESIASVVATTFQLADGGITAAPLTGGESSVSDPVLPPNGWLSFIQPDEGVTIPPASVYCELFNTSPHGTEFPYALSIAGDSDSFSLCKSSTSAQELIIYEATEDGAANAGLDYSTCEPVHVHLIYAD
ncbi:hypothetical protein FA95DRAFT_1572459 [Auriscalpium vulgare]|uniref:Uncharacterized protein n=1 Tax=Auriscalpium vulgare TaxID=40419 RepID=A0ACB8RU21_9AGAM|nr:hypothetical protein FA95DRAFT_1572459 [Auriscalpium vulgare]